MLKKEESNEKPIMVSQLELKHLQIVEVISWCNKDFETGEMAIVIDGDLCNLERYAPPVKINDVHNPCCRVKLTPDGTKLIVQN